MELSFKYSSNKFPSPLTHRVNTELGVVLSIIRGSSEPMFLEEYIQSTISDESLKYLYKIPERPDSTRQNIIKKLMKYRINLIE